MKGYERFSSNKGRQHKKGKVRWGNRTGQNKRREGKMRERLWAWDEVKKGLQKIVN